MPACGALRTRRATGSVRISARQRAFIDASAAGDLTTTAPEVVTGSTSKRSGCRSSVVDTGHQGTGRVPATAAGATKTTARVGKRPSRIPRPASTGQGGSGSENNEDRGNPRSRRRLALATAALSVAGLVLTGGSSASAAPAAHA